MLASTANLPYQAPLGRKEQCAPHRCHFGQFPAAVIGIGIARRGGSTVRGLRPGGSFGRALILVMVLAALAPCAARADTDLTIGGTAVVSYANGDDVRLRAAPGLDGAIVGLVPEGSGGSCPGGCTGASRALRCRRGSR